MERVPPGPSTSGMPLTSDMLTMTGEPDRHVGEIVPPDPSDLGMPLTADMQTMTEEPDRHVGEIVPPDPSNSGMPLTPDMQKMTEEPDRRVGGGKISRLKAKRKLTMHNPYKAKAALKRTPKKVSRALRMLGECDPVYDLITTEKKAMSAAVRTLDLMPEEDADKQQELARRMHDSVLRLAIPSDPLDVTMSPSKHRQASPLTESSWAGPLLEDCRSTYLKSPGADPNRFPRRVINFEHISNFSPRHGGLHLCKPGDPDWVRLQGIVTLKETNVYGAMIRDAAKMKFSSLWPQGTSEHDLVTIEGTSIPVVSKDGAEIVLVTLNSGKQCHAMKFREPGSIVSFFPLFTMMHVTAANPQVCQLDFDLGSGNTDVVVKFRSTDLLPIYMETFDEADFEDRDANLVYFDCTKHLRMWGLPATFERGFYACFNADEIRYKFSKAPSAPVPKLPPYSGIPRIDDLVFDRPQTPNFDSSDEEEEGACSAPEESELEIVFDDS